MDKEQYQKLVKGAIADGLRNGVSVKKLRQTAYENGDDMEWFDKELENAVSIYGGGEQMSEMGSITKTDATKKGEIDAFEKKKAQSNAVQLLYDSVSKYKSMVDQYGYETGWTEDSAKALGTYEGLRADIGMRVKQAKELGALDNGVLDYVQQYVGGSMKGGWGEGNWLPRLNLGGLQGTKASSALDVALNRIETEASLNGYTTAFDDVKKQELPDDVTEAIGYIKNNPDDPQSTVARNNLRKAGYGSYLEQVDKELGTNTQAEDELNAYADTKTEDLKKKDSIINGQPTVYGENTEKGKEEGKLLDTIIPKNNTRQVWLSGQYYEPEKDLDTKINEKWDVGRTLGSIFGGDTWGELVGETVGSTLIDLGVLGDSQKEFKKTIADTEKMYAEGKIDGEQRNQMLNSLAKNMASTTDINLPDAKALIADSIMIASNFYAPGSRLITRGTLAGKGIIGGTKAIAGQIAIQGTHGAVLGTAQAVKEGKNLDETKQMAEDYALLGAVVPFGTLGLSYVGKGLKGVGRVAGQTGRYAVKKATGLMDEDITEIVKNYDKYTPQNMEGITREGVFDKVKEAIDARIEGLSSTGNEYNAIRKSDATVYIGNDWVENMLRSKKFSIKDGKISATTKSPTRDTGDIAQLQKLMDDWSQKPYITAEEFLNMRDDLSKLSRFEDGVAKSNEVRGLARELRRKFNERFRGKLPKELKILDTSFEQQKKDLSNLKQKIYDKSGKLKDNAISLITRAGSPMNKELLRKLEVILPGIGDELTRLRTTESLQKAMSGRNVGAYTQSILGTGIGGATGGFPGMVAGFLLSNPQNLVRAMQAWGSIKRIPPKIIERVIENTKLGRFTKETVGMIDRAFRDIEKARERGRARIEDFIKNKVRPGLTIKTVGGGKAGYGEILEEEARKYKTAEEFVKAKIESVDEVPIETFAPSDKNWMESIKISGQIKKGRKVVEPVDVMYDINTGKLGITNGYHRYLQALENGDKTIKVKYIDNYHKQTSEQLIDLWKKAHGETGGVAYDNGEDIIDNGRVTRDRTSWRQGMLDIRERANTKGLSEKEKEIAEAIYSEIPQYRSASRILAQGKVYTRTSPQQGGARRDLSEDSGSAYVYEDGKVRRIITNLRRNRLKKAVSAYQAYRDGKIPSVVWENYTTGGYLTKKGLRYKYSDEQLQKMGAMAKSHADFSGNETGDSSLDHRIRARNRFDYGVKTEEEETAKILRGTKGMTDKEIMDKFPEIQLKRDVPAKDIHGNKVEIPKGEVLQPYELTGNKILLQDGQVYIVSKTQYQNIKGNSTMKEARAFAPELKDTEETVFGGANWKGDELYDTRGERIADVYEQDGKWYHRSDFVDESEPYATRKQAMKGAEVKTLDMGMSIGKTKEWRIVENGKPPHTFKTLDKNKMKVGLEIHSSEGSGESYIITDVLGDGKFWAVSKNHYDRLMKYKPNEKIHYNNALYPDRKTAIDGHSKEYDISRKATTQQGIRLTPEIKVKILGKEPEFKSSGVKYEAVKKEAVKKGAVKQEAGEEQPYKTRPGEEKRIVNEMRKSGSWTGKDENGKDVFGGKVVKGKELTIIIGLPAVGKSEVLANPISKKKGALLIDADRVKEKLTGFTPDKAPLYHQASSDIVEGALLTSAFENGENVVLPIIGKTKETVLGVARMAKKNGYKVHLVLNDAPPEVSVARAKARQAKTGRNIPEDYILNQVGLKPRQNFEEFKLMTDLFDTAEAYSNDVRYGHSLDLLYARTKTFSFSSPNVSVGMDYDGALKALKTEDHENARKFYQSIDKALGIPDATHSAIGKWTDGAENTFYYMDGDISKEDLIYATALKARGGGTAKTAQKQAIWFKSGFGDDVIIDIPLNGNDARQVSELLSKNGVEFQTVSNDRILLFNKSGDYFDENLVEKVQEATKGLKNQITTEASKGEGDFIGSWLEADDLAQRADALKNYDEIIKTYREMRGLDKM